MHLIISSNFGTNPNNWDTDGDELGDGDEVIIWKTDPLNPDTDGDTYLDGVELKAGYNPNGEGRFAEIPNSLDVTNCTEDQILETTEKVFVTLEEQGFEIAQEFKNEPAKALLPDAFADNLELYGNFLLRMSEEIKLICTVVSSPPAEVDNTDVEEDVSVE